MLGYSAPGLIVLPYSMGNRTTKRVCDPSGALKRQSGTVFNALNPLEQAIGGTDHTTRFSY
jgi:hypothetical protein